MDRRRRFLLLGGRTGGTPTVPPTDVTPDGALLLPDGSPLLLPDSATFLTP